MAGLNVAEIAMRFYFLALPTPDYLIADPLLMVIQFPLVIEWNWQFMEHIVAIAAKQANNVKNQH
jgi:hypothetical protein